MDLATEVARLADVAERMLSHQIALEREARAAAARPSLPPLRKTGVALFLQAIPGMAQQFDRTVPDEFVARVDSGTLEVACPCGQTPQVEPEQLSECECGRWFLYDGAAVRVALSPKS